MLVIIDWFKNKLEDCKENIFIEKLEQLCVDFHNENRTLIDKIEVYKNYDYVCIDCFTFDILIFYIGEHYDDYRIINNNDMDLEKMYNIDDLGEELETRIKKNLKDFGYPIIIRTNRYDVLEFLEFRDNKSELITGSL